MKEKIEELYSIHITKEEKLSDKVTKIYDNEKKFVLKEHETNLNNIYTRLYMSRVDYFLLPLKSINNIYVEEIDDKFYSLSVFEEDEQAKIDDIRLRFYILSLASLHQNSTYPIKGNDGYIDQLISFLEDNIEKNIVTLNTRMERIEHQDYHAPGEWFFYDNFSSIMEGYNLAKAHLQEVEELFKKVSSYSLCLTYQNYDISHIIINKGKIISLDKMNIAPSCYDISDFILKTYKDNVDFSSLIKEYLNNYKMNEEDKHLLLVLIISPLIEFTNDDLEDFEMIYDKLKLIDVVKEVEKLILSTSD